MDSNITGLWVNFFTAAGIPSEVAATYALTFTENRIQNDMLLDLNKEYLRDMGIIRMGDIIAILRHAKRVHENTARDKVLSTTSVTSKVPVAAVTGRSTVAQPSSQLKQTAKESAKPIFTRLGVKEKTDVVIPVPKDALKYEGILKSPPVVKRGFTVTSNNNIRKVNVGTMRADEAPMSVKDKLALPKAKSVKFSNKVEYKEIEAISNVVEKVNTFFNKPERRLAMPEMTVKGRLGVKKDQPNVVITKNIFKRLGI
ncbi:unnamed protein product [Leptidea sinapis]|uniref:SAM domain-containing protein n=1 Tax=Leptidea sinapis TaxID=189913 RepID=A0A5E4QXU6_9NEOP|nr:unnamed protein product [Leptidea sinapis]